MDGSNMTPLKAAPASSGLDIARIAKVIFADSELAGQYCDGKGRTCVIGGAGGRSRVGCFLVCPNDGGYGLSRFLRYGSGLRRSSA